MKQPPTRVGRGLLWCGGSALVRTGHRIVVSDGSQFLAVHASVRGMNGAMRSHNAAAQSHLRRPSARCRRQSRGPQRSIPNRPLRR
jgi:Na+-translocating ferredoxin:NAD+ oxidoreductase RnfC subunit